MMDLLHLIIFFVYLVYAEVEKRIVNTKKHSINLDCNHSEALKEPYQTFFK